LLGVANEAFLARMDTMRAGVDETREWDNSAQSRIVIGYAQLQMFIDHPLGAGHQGTAALSRGYLDEKWLAADSGDRSSHNTVLSVLVDQGLPGIVVFLVLAISITRTMRKKNRFADHESSDRNALYFAMLGGTLVAIIGCGMFAQFLKAEVQVWVLALIAVMLNHEMRIARKPDSVDSRR
jgi:O-antigen ligase